MIIAGIDAGQTGYICIYNTSTSSIIRTLKMPLLQKHKKFIDAQAVANMLIGVDRIFIEDQFSPHAKNQKGMKTNIMNYGILYSACINTNIEVIEVQPSIWTRALGLSNIGRSAFLPKLTKKDRLRKVKELFRVNLKNHNEADSILIAHYAHKFLLKK
jgi:hypothetical protein